MQQTSSDPRVQKFNALQALAANYGKAFDPNLLKLWLQLLEPYSVQAVNNAVLQVIQSYAFKTMPPFAELKKYLDGGDTAEQMLATRAEAEWSLLLRNISRYGWQSIPDDMHPTTEHVVRSMGGWQAVCSWTENDLHWRHKEFLELWQQYDGKADLMGEGALALEALHAERLAIATGQPVQRPAALGQHPGEQQQAVPPRARRMPSGFLRRVDDACQEERCSRITRFAQVAEAIQREGRELDSEYWKLRASQDYRPRLPKDPFGGRLSKEEQARLAQAVGERA